MALAGGIHSLRSLTNSQTFHPVVGPAAEAETIHVGGTRVVERARAAARGKFVIWDVGLGAGGQRAGGHRGTADGGRDRERRAPLSFDRSVAGAGFSRWNTRTALELHRGAERLDRRAAPGRGSGYPVSGQGIQPARVLVDPVGDFPAVVDFRARCASGAARDFLRSVFAGGQPGNVDAGVVHGSCARACVPDVPCLLTTYTRSTAVRVTLLLAGFYVGVGRSVGEKDETTVATNIPGDAGSSAGQKMGEQQGVRIHERGPVEGHVRRRGSIGGGELYARSNQH